MPKFTVIVRQFAEEVASIIVEAEHPIFIIRSE